MPKNDDNNLDPFYIPSPDLGVGEGLPPAQPLQPVQQPPAPAQQPPAPAQQPGSQKEDFNDFNDFAYFTGFADFGADFPNNGDTNNLFNQAGPAPFAAGLDAAFQNPTPQAAYPINNNGTQLPSNLQQLQVPPAIIQQQPIYQTPAQAAAAAAATQALTYQPATGPSQQYSFVTPQATAQPSSNLQQLQVPPAIIQQQPRNLTPAQAAAAAAAAATQGRTYLPATGPSQQYSFVTPQATAARVEAAPERPKPKRQSLEAQRAAGAAAAAAAAAAQPPPNLQQLQVPPAIFPQPPREKTVMPAHAAALVADAAERHARIKQHEAIRLARVMEEIQSKIDLAWEMLENNTLLTSEEYKKTQGKINFLTHMQIQYQEQSVERRGRGEKVALALLQDLYSMIKRGVKPDKNNNVYNSLFEAIFAAENMPYEIEKLAIKILINMKAPLLQGSKVKNGKMTQAFNLGFYTVGNNRTKGLALMELIVRHVETAKNEGSSLDPEIERIYKLMQEAKARVYPGFQENRTIENSALTFADLRRLMSTINHTFIPALPHYPKALNKYPEWSRSKSKEYFIGELVQYWKAENAPGRKKAQEKELSKKNIESFKTFFEKYIADEKSNKALHYKFYLAYLHKHKLVEKKPKLPENIRTKLLTENIYLKNDFLEFFKPLLDHMDYTPILHKRDSNNTMDEDEEFEAQLEEGVVKNIAYTRVWNIIQDYNFRLHKFSKMKVINISGLTKSLPNNQDTKTVPLYLVSGENKQITCFRAEMKDNNGAILRNILPSSETAPEFGQLETLQETIRNKQQSDAFPPALVLQKKTLFVKRKDIDEDDEEVYNNFSALDPNDDDASSVQYLSDDEEEPKAGRGDRVEDPKPGEDGSGDEDIAFRSDKKRHANQHWQGGVRKKRKGNGGGSFDPDSLGLGDSVRIGTDNNSPTTDENGDEPLGITGKSIKSTVDDFLGSRYETLTFRACEMILQSNRRKEDKANLAGALTAMLAKLSSESEQTITIPSGLSLKPYQKDAVEKMHHAKSHGVNPVLAADMGLGKTRMSFAAALAAQIKTFQATGEYRSNIIIVPNNLLINTKKEYLGAINLLREAGQLPEHLGREDNLVIVSNDKELDSNLQSSLDKKVPFIILSHTAFRNRTKDIDVNIKNKVASIGLDEIHLVTTNEKIDTFKRINEFLSPVYQDPNTLVYGLTGTPIRNDYKDLWNILRVLNQDKDFIFNDKNYEAFNSFMAYMFRELDGSNPTQAVTEAFELSHLINRLVRHTCIYLNKDDPDVLNDWDGDIPQLTEIKHTYNDPDFNRQKDCIEKYYRPGAKKDSAETGDIRSGVSIKLPANVFRMAFTFANLINDLKNIDAQDTVNGGISEATLQPEMLSNHPVLNALLQIQNPLFANKEPALDNIISTEQNALLFVSHHETGGLMQKYLTERYKNKANVYFIRSDVPLVERDRIMDLVAEEKEVPIPTIIIITPAIGGTGYSCRGVKHLFNLSSSWEHAQDAQATARIVRVGQRGDRYEYTVSFGTSFEEHQAILKSYKKAVSNCLIKERDEDKFKLSFIDMCMTRVKHHLFLQRLSPADFQRRANAIHLKLAAALNASTEIIPLGGPVPVPVPDHVPAPESVANTNANANGQQAPNNSNGTAHVVRVVRFAPPSPKPCNKIGFDDDNNNDDDSGDDFADLVDAGWDDEEGYVVQNRRLSSP